MSESASISSGIAERYATAVFEIAKENKVLPQVEANLDEIAVALAESAELRDLINSPIYSRDEQGKAIAAISKTMDLRP